MCTSHFSDLQSTCSSQFLLFIYFYFLSLNLTAKLFHTCTGCEFARMAAVPQGAFAARKVRQAREASSRNWQQNLMLSEDAAPGQDHFHQPTTVYTITETTMEQPMQYSSKLMNSIWGQYNRYSVHNFKKNTDGKLIAVGEHQLNAAVSRWPLTRFFQKQ